MIRPIEEKDLPQVRDIYNYYILHAIATFEETEIDLKEAKRRVDDITSDLFWIVYEDKDSILGYAYASKWNERSAYRYSAESTVYLRHGESGKGIGTALYSHLITRLKKLDFHSVIGGISLPNIASVSLHEKLGYEKVAHYKEVGFKFGKWIDVGYWQLIL